MMTGMFLLVCCGWLVLFCLSVQAYGKVNIQHLKELNIIVLGKKIRILDGDKEIFVKGAL